MDPVTNPFRPGAGTPPPALIGRDELIGGFTVTLKRVLKGKPGKSLMPIGLRGVGKTVLLNRFCEIAESEGLDTAQIETPEDANFLALLAGHVRKVLLSYDRVKQAKAAALKALRVLKSFSMTLSEDGPSFSFDVDALKGHGDSGIRDCPGLR